MKVSNRSRIAGVMQRGLKNRCPTFPKISKRGSSNKKVTMAPNRNNAKATTIRWLAATRTRWTCPTEVESLILQSVYTLSLKVPHRISWWRTRCAPPWIFTLTIETSIYKSPTTISIQPAPPSWIDGRCKERRTMVPRASCTETSIKMSRSRSDARPSCLDERIYYCKSSRHSMTRVRPKS